MFCFPSLFSNQNQTKAGSNIEEITAMAGDTETVSIQTTNEVTAVWQNSEGYWGEAKIWILWWSVNKFALNRIKATTISHCT